MKLTIILSSADLGKTIAEGKVKLTKGSLEEVAGVFDLFDKYVPGKTTRFRRPRISFPNYDRITG